MVEAGELLALEAGRFLGAVVLEPDADVVAAGPLVEGEEGFWGAFDGGRCEGEEEVFEGGEVRLEEAREDGLVEVGEGGEIGGRGNHVGNIRRGGRDARGIGCIAAFVLTNGGAGEKIEELSTVGTEGDG